MHEGPGSRTRNHSQSYEIDMHHGNTHDAFMHRGHMHPGYIHHGYMHRQEGQSQAGPKGCQLKIRATKAATYT